MKLIIVKINGEKVTLNNVTTAYHWLRNHGGNNIACLHVDFTVDGIDDSVSIPNNVIDYVSIHQE